MPSGPAAGRRTVGSPDRQAGFTMVELLVAMSLGILLIGGAVMVFTSASKSEPNTSMRSTQIRDGRVALDRMTRELRQATRVVTHSPTYLAVDTYVNTNCNGGSASEATLCRVIYQCGEGTCTRTLRATNNSGSAPSTIVVSGLSDDNVFQVPVGSSSPSYVGITLTFAKRDGGESVTLSDGVALRNLDAD